MGNSTFGTVRARDGFKHVSTAVLTGIETETTLVDANGNVYSSFTTGVSAYGTGGQANATALTTGWNNVTTCATEDDSVALPTAVAGLVVAVKNNGATRLSVFPFSADSINALAVNLSVNVEVGGLVTFRAISDTVWETDEVLTSHAPTTQRGSFVFKAVDNDADTTTTLSNAPMGQTSVISIPDPGGATGTVMLLEGAQTVVGAQTFSAAATFSAGSTGDVNGLAMATGEGTGWAGATTVSSEITKQGKIITTHLFVDIANLVVSTTLNDIIGDSAAANSHAGQFALAESGQFISGSITCLEAPTTGDADIDFNANSEATLAESVDVGGSGTNVILLANTEAWTLGMTKAMALLPDATSGYLYLSNGVGGGAGTYGAGQFLIELVGYEA